MPILSDKPYRPTSNMLIAMIQQRGESLFSHSTRTMQGPHKSQLPIDGVFPRIEHAKQFPSGIFNIDSSVETLLQEPAGMTDIIVIAMQLIGG
jgi:hypothetical protein